LLLIPPSAHLLAIIKTQPASSFFRRGIRLYGWIVVRVIPFFGPTILIDKSDPQQQPTIFAANHFSAIDPYCFGIVNTEHAMLTSWPFSIPFFKTMMKGGEYIDTRKGWESIQQKATALLKKKCNLIIWPEGHRSTDGKLGKFERGAFRLAVECQCPITPVCFINTNKIMARGQRFLSPRQPKVVLLPPIFPPADEKPRRAVKKLCEQTWQAIAAELTEHQHE
jgi:1-acyl-sn-glycerol-3-phosphate acyltransferase